MVFSSFLFKMIRINTTIVYEYSSQSLRIAIGTSVDPILDRG